MTSRLTIRCPACGQQFRGHKSERTRKNCIAHLIKQHGQTREQAQDRLIESGQHTPPTSFEECLRQEEELRARGVIV